MSIPHGCDNNVLRVQLCFRRLSIDGCSGKCWSKFADEKCHPVSLDICQHNHTIKMSVFEPNSPHLREVLIFCFFYKKNAAEPHRMLSSTYGEAALSERTCFEWFQRFKSGDFDFKGQHGGGKEKIFENSELEALLAENSCQTQEELAQSLGVTQEAISKRLKAMGMIQKQGNWVLYELKLRDVERRFFACEQLLQRQNRKGFLHRIVSGD